MCKPFSIAATPAPLVVNAFNISAIMYLQMVVQALILLLTLKASWDHVYTLPEKAVKTVNMTTPDCSCFLHLNIEGTDH